MYYNSYMVEKMASELRHDRLVEAENLNRVAQLRKALRERAKARQERPRRRIWQYLTATR